MLEIEVKYRAGDHAAVEAKLRHNSARLTEEREDADAYFNAPHRDFAQTDEALRIRRIGAGNFVTYKGPKTDAQTKTRREIEVALADGSTAAEQFQEILQVLGFRPVAVVRKRRRIFEMNRDGFTLHVSLDDVTGVGKYAEVEIVAPESDLEDLRKQPAKFPSARSLPSPVSRTVRKISPRDPAASSPRQR